MLTVAFPGQGAQRRGMLTPGLIAEFPDLIRCADAILGCPVEELCGRDPERRLDRTAFTQPALFVVNALLYLQRRRSEELAPDVAVGHSLGEYNALFAAEAFDFATGVAIVKKRGEVMDRAAGGAMAVVMDLTPERLSGILEENDLPVDLANFNAPLQTAVAGLSRDLDRARPLVEKAGGRWVALRVSGAFHSRHMQAAAEEFGAFLQDIRFAEPRIPVIANVTARPHEAGRIAETLTRHLTSPVRWTDSIRYLIGAGVARFEEVGPHRTLTPLIEQIRREPPRPEGGRAVRCDGTPVPKSMVAAGPRPVTPHITAESLGSRAFRETYGLRYAYLAGSMYKAIASEDLVVRMGAAGLLAFFGTGGLDPGRIEQAIASIRERLGRKRPGGERPGQGQPYGMNLLSNPSRPDLEMATVELFLRHGVDTVEASGYMQLTPAVVRYRLTGLAADGPEGPIARNRLIAKLSRPDTARLFLAPAPDALVGSLVDNGHITPEEARLARFVPMADDVCVEADSAGHTDRRSAHAILPAVMSLRDDMMRDHGFTRAVRVGLAGGIGTPQAAAAAFVMGADFILTGSINQCTVEAGISDAVKDLLERMDVQDTDYAPAGDMFEIGAQIQVLKRGLLFPARANKLYELYRTHSSLESIDPRTRANIEEKYFGKTFEKVYQETKSYWIRVNPAEIERAEQDEKHKMALVFKWYFVHTMRLALRGSDVQRLDYQVHCGPALGGFNRWVKGTEQEAWRSRHVDKIAERLMVATAEVLNTRLAGLAPATA